MSTIKIKLLREYNQDNKITHAVGKELTIDKDEALYLISRGAAISIEGVSKIVNNATKKETDSSNVDGLNNIDNLDNLTGENEAGGQNDSVKTEAIIKELMQLKNVDEKLATELVNAGIEGIEDLAETEEKSLASLPAIRTVKFAKSLIQTAEAFIIITKGE